MSVSIKQGDTAPSLVYNLKDNFDTTPTAIDLTTATSVTFKMRLASATAATAPAVSSAATISNAAQGEVTYDWATGDTDVSGTYEAEFQILWSDSTIETVPNTGYVTIEVIEDLDADA